jgi:uncharacterized protein YndB with AHSA1/START domain
MTAQPTPDLYGKLIEPTTLKIQRLLPGTVERVWAFLTDSDLRRKWLAAGQMDLKQGAPFELVWRNDELTTPPGHRPDGFAVEQRMESRIIEIDPPRKLAISWDGTGDVTFELAPAGERVLLTIVHRRLPDRGMKLNVSAGWHAHVDILAAAMAGEIPAPFWDNWVSLKMDYDQRLPE